MQENSNDNNTYIRDDNSYQSHLNDNVLNNNESSVITSASPKLPQRSVNKNKQDLEKVFSRLRQDHLPEKSFLIYAPSKHAVDAEALFDEIALTLRRFLVIESYQADAATLWVIHTYLVGIFKNTPLALINAPERACAKSLFQEILAKLSCRPLLSSSISPSALFRSIEAWQPTIFFDEADMTFKGNNELAGIINSGYSSNGMIFRCEATDESFEPRGFSVYCAKSLAGICLEKVLPDATMSRSIVFKMRRKLSDEKVERLRFAEENLFEDLCSKIVRFVKDHAEQISNARPTLPEKLNDRAQDNWEPLFAIASCAGDRWLQRVNHAALMMSSNDSEVMSTGNELLSDIKVIFEAAVANNPHQKHISSNALITELIETEEGPWATYNKGRPISTRQLAKLLSSYEIKSKTVRLDAYNTPKGYEFAQFTEAFTRYLSPQKLPTDLPEIVPVAPVSAAEILSEAPSAEDNRVY